MAVIKIPVTITYKNYPQAPRATLHSYHYEKRKKTSLVYIVVFCTLIGASLAFASPVLGLVFIGGCGYAIYYYFKILPTRIDEEAVHEAQEVREAEEQGRQRWASLLAPSERLWALCYGDNKQLYVLTDRRLVVEGSEKKREVPLQNIQRVMATTMNAEPTGVPDTCWCIRLKTVGADVTLVRYSPSFVNMARCFITMQG